MAEGFGRRLARPGVRVWSAGTRPAGVNPEAVRAMAEAGVDIAGQASKDLAGVPLDVIDTVVTLCGDAAESCPVLPRSVLRIHWPLADPARARGSQEEVRAAFRSARDEIGARVAGLMAAASGEEPFPLLSKARVYDGGSVVKVDRERVALPGGAVADLEIIHHPGASAVVPLHGDGTVTLIRQYRHAAGGYILEVPAGKLDAGEHPDSCARREVEEEAGLRAGRLHRLGSIYTTPGFTDEVIHLYAAADLVPTRQALEHDEVIEVLRLPFARTLDMVASNEIRDSKTACALYRADFELRAGRLKP